MRAIDIHCHLGTKEFNVIFKDIGKAIEHYYGYKIEDMSEEEMVKGLREADVKAFIIGLDCESTVGKGAICTNDYVQGLVKKYPDVYWGGFATVDPWKGKKAVMEIERAIKELGMVGVKFQSIVQAFFPNDRRFYLLYEKCAELRVPVQFHSGTTGYGAGLPGGGGAHLKYTKPIPCLDDVAADFPDLTIIAAHPSWPWQDEMIAVLLHKGNVYEELSGWSPKYFTSALKREIRGRLQDKFMFGSDYPVLSYKRLFKDWEEEDYPPEVLEKVFYKNAHRIMNLK